MLFFATSARVYVAAFAGPNREVSLSFDSVLAETGFAEDVLAEACELRLGSKTNKSVETPIIERNDLEMAFITGVVLCSALFLSLVSLIL